MVQQAVMAGGWVVVVQGMAVVVSVACGRVVTQLLTLPAFNGGGGGELVSLECLVLLTRRDMDAKLGMDPEGAENKVGPSCQTTNHLDTGLSVVAGTLRTRPRPPGFQDWTGGFP
jgi:hypothetical protein